MSLAPTYYAALGLTPAASLAQIQRAYRRLALKYHPDSNTENLPVQQCELLLQQLSNALEALSDKRLRTLYDKRGAEGLESHSFKDAHRVFDEFFGTANPFEAVLPAAGDGPSPAARALAEFAAVPKSTPYRLFAAPATATATASATATAGATTSSSLSSSSSSSLSSGFTKGRTAAASLPMTLEELFNGCQRRICIKRKRVRPGGAGFEHETCYLNVHVPPGMPAGTEIRFENAGDEEPGCLPSDIVFRVEERPHPQCVRSGGVFFCLFRCLCALGRSLRAQR